MRSGTSALSKLLCMIIVMLFLTSGFSVFAAPAATMPAASGDVQISAAAAILTDSETGQVLFSKSPKTRLHISSVNKLMTVLIAIEKGDLASNVTISKDSVEADGSALSLEVGKKYALMDLLYGIMLTSANDAAKAVSEHIGGDSSKFVKLMNDEAARLNMGNTHFTNPTGLYDENQYTTAEDISLLMKYALTKPAFNTMFSVKARPWENAEGLSKILTSQNKLFWSYDGVDGGKTGYNDKDQQTVIASAQRENMRLICIVLDSPEKSLFTDAAAVFDYGFDRFRKSILVHKGDVLKTAKVGDSEINLISMNDIYYVHPLGDSYIKDFSSASFIEPPIKKSKAAGNATYTLGDGTTISVDLFPEKEIVPPDDFLTSARKKIQENRNILYLVVFLLLLEVILVIVNLVKLIKRVFRKILRKRIN
jgi:D-alanyl-D-alanine carboxypeptidase/D-alanyl-D-alanine carboxypeptidase (penicillin-binding protein 5/6)